MNSLSPTSEPENPPTPTSSEASSKPPRKRLSPKEILESGKPYVTYGDQYIETAFLPNPKCSCKGIGHYGSLAPQGKQMVNDLKLGRNASCMCGSGKKYKKCCSERVERLSKGGYRILICACVGDAFLAENPVVDAFRQELATQWKVPPKLPAPESGSILPE